VSARRATMNSTLSLAELDDRIAILRDNLRQLVEQAAAASGSQNEERIADRITQQTEELDKLILERDSRAKK
jgi:predicted RNA-binding protein